MKSVKQIIAAEVEREPKSNNINSKRIERERKRWTTKKEVKMPNLTKGTPGPYDQKKKSVQ